MEVRPPRRASRGPCRVRRPVGPRSRPGRTTVPTPGGTLQAAAVVRWRDERRGPRCAGPPARPARRRVRRARRADGAVGAPAVRSRHAAVDDRTLGLVDFTLFPHLDAVPTNTMAAAESRAAGMGVPAYAVGEQTALVVDDGVVEVASRGRWRSRSRRATPPRPGPPRPGPPRPGLSRPSPRSASSPSRTGSPRPSPMPRRRRRARRRSRAPPCRAGRGIGRCRRWRAPG